MQESLLKNQLSVTSHLVSSYSCHYLSYTALIPLWEPMVRLLVNQSCCVPAIILATGVKLVGHAVPGTVVCFFPGTVVSLVTLTLTHCYYWTLTSSHIIKIIKVREGESLGQTCLFPLCSTFLLIWNTCPTILRLAQTTHTSCPEQMGLSLMQKNMEYR